MTGLQMVFLVLAVALGCAVYRYFLGTGVRKWIALLAGLMMALITGAIMDKEGQKYTNNQSSANATNKRNADGGLGKELPTPPQSSQQPIVPQTSKPSPRELAMQTEQTRADGALLLQALRLADPTGAMFLSVTTDNAGLPHTAIVHVGVAWHRQDIHERKAATGHIGRMWRTIHGPHANNEMCPVLIWAVDGIQVGRDFGGWVAVDD